MPLVGLLVLAAPGMLAAWLAQRYGQLEEVEREGALAGLITAHFASALLVVALILGALDIDWTVYEAQVGVQIAGEVRDAVVPAVAVAGAVSVVVVNAWCVTAGWLGALLYKRLAGLR